MVFEKPLQCFLKYKKIYSYVQLNTYFTVIIKYWFTLLLEVLHMKKIFVDLKMYSVYMQIYDLMRLN